jgi:UDP-N-acetyl-D-glucosamine dehydrogenase
MTTARRPLDPGDVRAPGQSTTSTVEWLRTALEAKTARITVVGQGYVGLPLAVELARSGFQVTGIETDPARVAALQRGESYIPDVPAGELVEVVEAGRYHATASPEALAEQDAIVVCVPTPLRKSREPDVSHVVAAAEGIARHLRTGQLVVLESTTYPGTTEELLLPLFQRGGLRVGADVFLAFSPERIDPGNQRYRIKDIPKLVGGVTPACTRLAATLYRQIVARVHEVSSPRVAELAKLYENTFRAVNIALANEMALVCRALGADVWEVIDAAATKPFGFMPFYPGPGIGGHCIPVDPFYLAWKARLDGYDPKLIAVADQINRAMPQHVVELVTAALNDRGKPVKGSRILVLGVAYKKGVGDVRESPALDVVATLLRKGARVDYADPHVPALAVGGHRLAAVPVTAERLREADAVLILTDHREFDYAGVARATTLVVDVRHAIQGPAAAGAPLVRL